jgi:hypothetical protein
MDFTGVETSGRSISDGWATGRIKAAEVQTSKDAGNLMFEVQWAVTRGKEKATVYDYFVNSESALWKVKLALEACGMDVPDGALDLNVDDLLDLECDVLIANDDSYDGKPRPKIADYRPASGDTDDEEVEKAPQKGDDEGDDEDEEEDSPRRPTKTSRKEEEEEGGDDDSGEEEGEEEAEPPKKKSKSKIRVGSKVSFEDEKGKTVRGVVKAVDDDEFIVKTSKGDEYGVSESDLELA